MYDENDHRTRYRKQFVVFIVWIILFVAFAINVFSPKGQPVQSLFLPPVHESSFNAFLPRIVCGFVVAGLLLQGFQLLKTRRKLLEQPDFRKRAKRLPPLFWQSFFILLPVAGLACFGLYSLRQDRLLAEQEAHESGQVLAQQLAQAIGAGAAQSLNDYREAGLDLDANSLADIGASHWQGGTQSENQAWHEIALWRQANPKIDLSSMPSADNGSYELALGPMPPQPPEWLMKLNSRQRQLWEAAKATELASVNFGSVQAAVSKFIESKPPAAARANAEYLLLLAKTRGLPNKDAAAAFASKWNQSDYLSEAGLPLGQLMCYQALRLTPDGAGVPEDFLENIFWVIVWKPSFFSERLIAEAGRVAKGAKSERAAASLRLWWERRQKALEVLDDFQKQDPKNGWDAGVLNVYSRPGQFLLFLGGQLSGPTNLVPPCLYLVVPQAVVVKALETAMKRSGISVPDYFQTVFQIGSDEITLAREPDGAVAPALNVRFVPAGAKVVTLPNGSKGIMADFPDLPVFGQADGTWQDLWGLNTDKTHYTYPFQVRILLANPDLLYSQQRERALMFAGLIVLSTIAALSALFAAWRSFRRERQLSEMKTNFVSSVSHELRAPIASVRLMAENLERGRIPEAGRQNEYFRFIVQECRRLSSLIENVLDFSRIEQGRKQYEFEPTDLIALVQTTVKLMEPYAAEKGIRLIVNCELRIAEWNVDGRAIQQALVNLIDNAVKHSPKGEIVTVEIADDPADAQRPDVGGPRLIRNPQSAIRISVSDHGPGIPREEHEKIFERFYRLGSELRRETQGVGIGLSVVKHIMEAHGGRVIVESEPGRGSRFTIELQNFEQQRSKEAKLNAKNTD